MLVAFELRAAAPGIPRQCTTCSLGRRLESKRPPRALWTRKIPPARDGRRRPAAPRPDKETSAGTGSGDWPVSTDSSVHVEVLKKLFDSDVTIGNVHSGQPNQQKGIEFYANNVPPDSGTARSPIATLAIFRKTSRRWRHGPARRLEVGCAALLTNARQPRAA
jgi:hypothetical protein